MTASPQRGAMTKQGKRPCGRPAGWGTSHAGYGKCKLHGGSSQSGALYAAKLEAADRAERIRRVMVPVEVDPLDALLQCIWIAKGEVDYCSARIAEFREDEAVVQFREEQDGDEASYVKTSSEASLHHLDQGA